MRIVALIATLATSCCSAAWCQVIAHPNQIRGSVTVTNTNPDIVALLMTGDGGMQTIPVAATTAGTPTLSASTVGVVDDPMHGHYELTAEGFDAGMAYDVTVSPRFQNLARGIGRRSAPLFPEPASDVILDFEICVGVVRVNLVDLEGAPLLDGSARVNGRLPPTGSDVISFVAAEGTRLSFYVTVNTGSDPLHDTVTVTYHAGEAIVTCDEVTSIECVIDPNPCDAPGGGGGSGDVPMGRIIGNIDVVGATLVPTGAPRDINTATTRVSATGGPFGNARHDILNVPDRLRGPFELENLVASEAVQPPQGYTVSSFVKLDVDGVVQRLDLPSVIGVPVPTSGTTDLGDALVVHPARLQSEIFIVGPPRSAARGRSMLADAVPDGLEWASTGSWGVAAGATRGSYGMHASAKARDATFHEGPSVLSARSALLTGGLDGAGSIQSFDALRIHLEHKEDPSVPQDWYDQDVAMHEPDFVDVDVQPGDVIDVPFRACFGQVFIGIRSTGAPLRSTFITALGAPPASDFEGRPGRGARVTGGSGLPDPAVTGPDVRGSVKLALQEGGYTLEPRVQFVNPGGGYSTAELPPIPLHVGCRQVLTGVPQLVAQVTQAPSCIGRSPVTISGSVHAEEEVASITWSVDGGPRHEYCRPCGLLPSYSISVPGTGSEMSVLVEAVDALGREASVTHFARFSEEPSALDRDPSATPLRVTREGDDFELAWGEAAGSAHVLYRGTLESLGSGRYDHAEFGACGLSLPTWTGSLPEGGFYFLATAACGFGDASLGRDSHGQERPGAGPRCP